MVTRYALKYSITDCNKLNEGISVNPENLLNLTYQETILKNLTVQQFHKKHFLKIAVNWEISIPSVNYIAS